MRRDGSKAGAAPAARLWADLRSRRGAHDVHRPSEVRNDSGALDRGADARVGAAAADIAHHRGVDLGVVRMRIGRQQFGRRHDLAGLTITALRHVELHPRRLQSLPHRVRRHALDRGDGGTADGRDRSHAGAHRPAVEMDGASAAQPGAAAELAAFQVEFVPQHPQQRCVAVDVDRPFLTIHFDRIRHFSRL